jgi:hypothetical protein
MSAYDQLAIQCERRGWRLCLCGSYPIGKHQPGLIVNNLAVRSHPRTGRELLASAVAGVGVSVSDGTDGLDAAAVDCARSLERQGLLA